jgi:hypothetical protein
MYDKYRGKQQFGPNPYLCPYLHRSLPPDHHFQHFNYGSFTFCKNGQDLEIKVERAKGEEM